MPVQDLGEMADTGDVRTRTTEPRRVAYTVHRSSGIEGAIERLRMWIAVQDCETVGPPTVVYYTSPDLIPGEELLMEIPIRGED